MSKKLKLVVFTLALLFGLGVLSNQSAPAEKATAAKGRTSLVIL